MLQVGNTLSVLGGAILLFLQASKWLMTRRLELAKRSGNADVRNLMIAVEKKNSFLLRQQTPGYAMLFVLGALLTIVGLVLVFHS